MICNFLKSIFVSPRGTVSSKRLTGYLMITLAGFLICSSAFVEIKTKTESFNLNSVNILDQKFDSNLKYLNVGFSDNLTSLIKDLIYGGVALLGSTVFEKKFKQIENNNNENQQS